MMVIMIAVDTKLKKRVSSNDIIQNIVKTKKEYEKMIKAKNQESAKKTSIYKTWKKGKPNGIYKKGDVKNYHLLSENFNPKD